MTPEDIAPPPIQQEVDWDELLGIEGGNGDGGGEFETSSATLASPETNSAPLASPETNSSPLASPERKLLNERIRVAVKLPFPRQLCMQVLEMPESLRHAGTIATDGHYAISSVGQPGLRNKELWLWGCDTNEDNRPLSYIYATVEEANRAVAAFRQLIHQWNKEHAYGGRLTEEECWKKLEEIRPCGEYVNRHDAMAMVRWALDRVAQPLITASKPPDGTEILE